MLNRQLSPNELKNLASPLLKSVRKRLKAAAKGNAQLLWALRRKVYKELMYDERGKPMYRRKLKWQKIIEQKGKCAVCKKQLPDIGSILDRHKAMDGYTPTNTRLLCAKCDAKIQAARKYR